MTQDEAVRVRRHALSLWVLLVGLVVIFAGFVGLARATDTSMFCGSCHEMRPYYAEWKSGPHSGQAQCVDCHVDAGFAPRVTRKVVALSEVCQHFLGYRSFPLVAPPDIPDSRCVRCHPHLEVDQAKASHRLHAENRPCQECHRCSGHDDTAGGAGVVGAAMPPGDD